MFFVVFPFVISLFFSMHSGLLFSKNDLGKDDQSASVSFFEQFGDLSEEEIEKRLSQEGIDPDELKSIVVEDIKDVQKRSAKAHAATVATQPTISSTVDKSKVASKPSGKKNLQDLIAEHKERMGNDDESLKNYLVFHTTPAAENIPEPGEPIIELGSKLTKFMDTHVRGKKVEVIAMAGFFVYRQLAWLGEEYAKEKKTGFMGYEDERKPVEKLLGMSFFDSKFLTYADFLLRSSFCAVRFYLDATEVWQAMKNPLQMLQDPDAYLQFMMSKLQRAYAMYYRRDYFSGQLSLLNRVLMELALPFIWTGLLSRKESYGDSLSHPIMRKALMNSVNLVSQSVVAKPLMNRYSRISQEKRDKLFKQSAGIIHPDLFSKLSLWATNYTTNRFVFNNKKLNAKNYFVRKLGEYGIRNVYLNYVVKLIKEIVRRGGLQAAGNLVHKLGWVLSKLGFFQKNPLDTSNQFLKKQLVTIELLTPDQDMKELLVYPAAVCPGAFARAVTKVITKQKVAAVLAKEPRFISSLNAMAGVSVYDLMQRLAMNIMTLQEMSARVALIKNAVDPKDWAKILNNFLNEAIAEIFFDRKHIICRNFTESIIGFMSKPLLNGIYDAVLPAEQELVVGSAFAD